MKFPGWPHRTGRQQVPGSGPRARPLPPLGLVLRRPLGTLSINDHALNLNICLRVVRSISFRRSLVKSNSRLDAHRWTAGRGGDTANPGYLLHSACSIDIDPIIGTAEINTVCVYFS
jgi:hypothetical protein